MSLIFQKLIPNAITPKLSLFTPACIYTLYAPETTVLHPGLRSYIRTGIHIELPPNTLLQLSPVCYGANIEMNGTYFITAGHRASEILVPLLNKENVHIEIKRGESIAEFALLQLHPTGGLFERVATVQTAPTLGAKVTQARRPRGRPRKQVKLTLD